MTTKKKKKGAKKKVAKKTGGNKWKPEPIPAGVTGDVKKTFQIANRWAKVLLKFNQDVYDEFHDLDEQIAALKARVATLEGKTVQPTAGTTHISDPPDPPYIT